MIIWGNQVPSEAAVGKAVRAADCAEPKLLTAHDDSGQGGVLDEERRGLAANEAARPAGEDE